MHFSFCNKIIAYSNMAGFPLQTTHKFSFNKIPIDNCNNNREVFEKGTHNARAWK